MSIFDLSCTFRIVQIIILCDALVTLRLCGRKIIATKSQRHEGFTKTNDISLSVYTRFFRIVLTTELRILFSPLHLSEQWPEFSKAMIKKGKRAGIKKRPLHLFETASNKVMKIILLQLELNRNGIGYANRLSTLFSWFPVGYQVNNPDCFGIQGRID